MEKILFLGLLLAGLFIVYSCVPSEELPGEENTAIAGLAISMGCQTYSRGVTSCITNADGSISVTTRASSRVSPVADSCRSGVAYDYSCIPGKAGGRSTAYRLCRTQCESAEDCVNAQCISRCGNGRVDAGETCSSCAADIRCAEGQVCQEGACVASCTDTDSDNDVAIQGTVSVTATGYSQSDYCEFPTGGGRLYQVNCDANTALGVITFINSCPGFNDFCRDGICVLEICDDVDNDGDGLIDEDCNDDIDDYCDGRMEVVGTPAVCPNGAGDCDDQLPLINPEAAEVCSNNFDDNCNGRINDGCEPPPFCDSESVLIPLNIRQPLREVKPEITSADLPEMLGDGSVTNSFGTSNYQQELSFEITNSSIMYGENDDDITSHFYLQRNARPLTLYELTFSPAWSSSNSGTRLLDFENTKLNILGKIYSVALAQRPTTAPSQGIRLILMKDSTRDILRAAETRTYTVDGRNYGITLDYIDEDQCKFIINDEITNLLRVGDSYVLATKDEIFVSGLTYGTGIESNCTFFIGSERIELRDDRITASDQSRWGTPLSGAFPVRVGSEIVDGSVVIISGTDTADTFSINSIAVNMTAEDEYYVGRGQLLSNVITVAGDERELLFTNNWDIRFNEFNAATNSGILEIGKICPTYPPVCIDYDADAANPELIPGGAIGLGYAWEYNAWSMQLRGDQCESNPEGGVRVFERYCSLDSSDHRAYGRYIICPEGTTCVTENSCG